MNRIAIAENGTHFVREGKPYFWLADTVWSAFSSATPDEWELYLDRRREQRFNALQISILPILHDRSDTEVGPNPFRLNEDGSWDWDAIDEAFFARAARMAEMAVERGFLLCLVVLWGNYAPGNWMSRLSNGSHVMPFDAVGRYAEFVARTFGKFGPVYLISGDTNYETQEAEKHYLEALKAVKRVDPEALVSLHMNGGTHEIPESLESSIDFYAYQSSHELASQSLAYTLAERFKEKRTLRPILNAEPCYEGIGYFKQYGRFGAGDVRKAFWWSVLSGASAGFTYGAHGLWSWHRKGAAFSSEEAFLTPFVWSTALRLPGADDLAFSSWLFEQYGLVGVSSAQRLLVDAVPEVRVAAAGDLDMIVLYAPASRKLTLRVAADEYRWEMFDLERRLPLAPIVRRGPEGAAIELPETGADMLLSAVRLKRSAVR